MTTIKTNKTLGVALDPATYANPVMIAPGVTVANAAGAAVAAFPGFAEAFIVQNYGVILAGKTGIYLAPGGTITNAAAASISAGGNGIYIDGGFGTVVNYGSIVAPTAFGIDLNGGGSVINAASGSISGIDGVLTAGTVAGAGNVLNEGRIAATGSRGAGVVLGYGGSITNDASGTIVGGYGVVIETPGTAVNYGSIAGVGVAGLFLDAGGTITNEAAAAISGIGNGVDLGGYGTVANRGSIAATGSVGIGVYLSARGAVSNAAGGSIVGAEFGVSMDDGGTLLNAGTIATAVGNAGTAAVFGGTQFNRLVLYPGFAFAGVVIGSRSAGNTLELASAAATGTVTGLGSRFVDFYLIQFDAGAQRLLAGGTAALAGGEAISGFTAGDTIDLVGVSETVAGFGFGTLALAGTAPLDLLLSDKFATRQFHTTTSSDGTDLTVACFAAGTRILSDAGEVAVEQLRPGTRVVSLLHGTTLPVAWLGQRRFRAALHSRPWEVWPVRVRAGAFGTGVPHRDLVLSPDHAVYVAPGVLVPVRYLINGATIVRQPSDEILYYHVELATHAVLLAEGLPAESYLDTGNRAGFATQRPLAAPPPLALEAPLRMGA